MNRQEARRYAHKLAADGLDYTLASLSLGGYEHTSDGLEIVQALRALTEQHRRYGPKTTDRPPRLRVRAETPLFDALEPTQQDLAS
jgi:hypothetical protein